MAIPDYADPRSHKHFSRGFVGTKGGENGTQYSTDWSSTSDVQPTSCHSFDNGYKHTCVYCGNRPFPIQDHVGDSVRHHACVCKEAMDEVEWVSSYNAMLMRHSAEKEQLEKTAPKPNPNVLAKVVKISADKIISEVERGWGHSELKRLGVQRATPLDQFKD